MTDTIPAFPNLLNHVWSLIPNEGNVHSCLVVSMRRKCKPEEHTQNNCSYEFYLSELRVKKAISNIHLLKVTMEADILQARGGLWFPCSDLQIPTHVLPPRPPSPHCASVARPKVMSWACIYTEDVMGCAYAAKYCRCNVSTPSSTLWLRTTGHLTAKKRCVPSIFIIDEQLFDLQSY